MRCKQSGGEGPRKDNLRKRALLLPMMTAVVLLSCGIVLAQESTTSGRTPAQSAIPGQYIVVLKDEIRDPTEVARVHAQRYGAQMLYRHEHALKGYAARIPDRRLDDVRADSRVAFVEPDQTAQAEAQTLPWGIDRVQADISSTKAGNHAGAISNVNVYIIDSGIYRHADLNVVKHVNFTGDGKNHDCYGHGTHVTGIAAAKDNRRYVVGVAPGAPLTGVKVLNCDGKGTASGLIKGVDWVSANAKKPAIANMSVGLGGNPSDALDKAVRNSAASGVFFSLAAGNKGTGRCSGSPARTGAGTNNGIATVAATDRSNPETSWSNYGKCVDIWAPGAKILSTKIGGGTTTKGGASMAAPHVGGGGALYLSKHTSASSSTVEAALKRAATKPGTRSKGGRLILLENVRSF
jgi:subtilisin family serine protease